jgi:type IV pilus assembly protein PilB
MSQTAFVRVGLTFVRSGLISQQQLADALQLQKLTGHSLVKSLIELGYAKATDLLPKITSQLGYQYIDLTEYKINPTAYATIPEELAKRYLALPIDFIDGKLLVVMASPDNLLAIDDLQMASGYDLKIAIATKEEIEEAFNRLQQMPQELVTESSEEADLNIQAISEDAPVVKLVNLIISQGVEQRASDIHIEPQEEDLRVRYRVDGVLHEAMRSPKKIQPAVLSRLKIMSQLDIAETRKPQDGRCSLAIKGRQVDFRVATLPTVYGERVVLRVLEKESILLKLDDLGFLPESLARFRSAFTKPYGAILVTGPTGSGKSTTLYATLNVLNTEGKNIVTVEDPVEYRLPGINQVQINTKAGLTFARGLRAILRASPDIVMVGEIRDAETAQIAIEAALTGHLVLSTLHTNDAPGAISRLTEMGIPPFLIASAIDCVQAQRLARRLCPACKQPYKPDLDELRAVGFPVTEGEELTLYKPAGCQKCNDTGYKGRVGLYEVMLMSEKIERLTVEGATAEEIKKVALEEGMQTLRQDGMQKVKLGLTSIEEVLRVVV